MNSLQGLERTATTPFHITEGEPLAGGVISSVTAGEMWRDGETEPIPVVIKRTHSDVVGGPQFSDSDKELLEKAPATHDLDAEVLWRLQDEALIRVPKVFATDSVKHETIMRDFRADGFRLMQDQLVEGSLPMATAWKVGHALAFLQIRLASLELGGLEPVEDSRVQMKERLWEAKTLLYDQLATYDQLETDFLDGDDPQLLYTDGHPKNMAIHPDGEVMLFDFGRIIRGSGQYPPANFTGQIGLATIGGALAPANGIEYIRQTVRAYDQVIPVDQTRFVRFFAAELIHRGLAMRWIDKRVAQRTGLDRTKLAAYGFFLKVFNIENPIQTLDGMLDTLGETAEQAQADALENTGR